MTKMTLVNGGMADQRIVEIAVTLATLDVFDLNDAGAITDFELAMLLRLNPRGVGERIEAGARRVAA